MNVRIVMRSILTRLQSGGRKFAGPPWLRSTASGNACTIAALVAAVSLALPAGAQRNVDPEAFYRAPSTLNGKTVIIPVGTTLEGRMDMSIGSSISTPGQRFTITMASPVLANGQEVIIPAGAQIVGEVVEAIPSKDLPKAKKGMPKPTGKLRVQLTSLRMPDGMTYPLVASLTGETITMGRRVMANPGLGGGIGYAGTAAGFEAVGPGMADRYRGRGGRGPMVMNAQQFMRDPIYGSQAQMTNALRSGLAQSQIRALVRREHDLFIDEGSPLSIRLEAPFKIAVRATGSAGQALPDLDEQAPEERWAEGGRRFSRTRTPSPAGGGSPDGTFAGGGAFPSGNAGGEVAPGVTGEGGGIAPAQSFTPQQPPKPPAQQDDF